MPDSSGTVLSTLWKEGSCLSSVFLGGVIGNLAASLVWDVAKYAAKPLLDKVPEVSELLQLGGQGANHDLLRALRRAECAALVATLNDCILNYSGIRMDAGSAREFLKARWQSRSDPTLEALCRLRHTFNRLFLSLKDLSVDDLVRLNGGALSDLPILVSTGKECFDTDDVGQLRQKVVGTYIAWLGEAVTAPARFAGIDKHGLDAVLPRGLPEQLTQHLTRHPNGWWDYLRVAFREELKNPENVRARTAWELDIQSRIQDQLGASYERMAERLDSVDKTLDRQWTFLQSLREDFDHFTIEVLEWLQQIDVGVAEANTKLDTLLAGNGLAARAGPRGPAWHQLEPVPEHFFGRDETTAQLAADLRDAVACGDRSRQVRVIEGAGGLGKTSLAFAVGHALEANFPDLQFVVRLYTNAAVPLTAEQARDRLLQLLYPNTALADEDDRRWNTYRNLFRQPDGQAVRGLLILDDCASESQLRSLQPTVAMPVIVTSRRVLPMGATEELPPLDPASARRVLASIHPPLDRDPQSAGELAKVCGYFPIALRAVAARLRRSKRQGNALRDFLAELRSNRFGAMASSDSASDPRSILEFSLRLLAPVELLALQALSVFTADFDRAAARATADCTEAVLDALIELHLIEVRASEGRLYWLDLLRELAANKQSPADRQAAEERFVAHFAEVCHACGLPFTEGRGGFEEARQTVSHELAHIRRALKRLRQAEVNPALSRKWAVSLDYRLVAYRVSMVDLENCYGAGIRLSREAGDPDAAGTCALSLALCEYFAHRTSLAREHYQTALETYRETGNRLGEANALRGLGEVAWMQDDYAAALGYFQDSLKTCSEIGNCLGEADALCGLGDVARMHNDYAAALGYFQAALEIYRKIGNRLGEAHAVRGLGDVARMQDDDTTAREHFQTSLRTYREIGDRMREAHALRGLAHASLMRDDSAASLESFQAALDIYREIGNRLGEASALNGMGNVARAQDDSAAASGYFFAALDICRGIGNRLIEADALRGLGGVSQMQSDYAAAREHFHSALAIYREISSRLGEGHALCGLGEVAWAQGDNAAARSHFQAALDIFRKLGSKRWISQIEIHIANLLSG